MSEKKKPLPNEFWEFCTSRIRFIGYMLNGNMVWEDSDGRIEQLEECVGTHPFVYVPGCDSFEWKQQDHSIDMSDSWNEPLIPEIDGGPAFPKGHLDGPHVDPSGMTLRDYFAIRILSAAMTRSELDKLPEDKICEWSYRFADYMLKARS